MAQINWVCKFCFKDFEFNSKYQIGGHLTNCLANPKRNEIIKKSTDRIRSLFCLPRINFKQSCKRCEKEFIQILTINDINSHRYNSYCDKICANSISSDKALKFKEERLKIIEVIGNLSLEEKIKKLRAQGLSILNISRLISVKKKIVSDIVKSIELSNVHNSQSHKPKLGKNNTLRMLDRQNKWKFEANDIYLKNKNNPLFMLGIGLYWGEGAKTRNLFSISNSDPGVLRKWIEWHKEFTVNLKLTPTIFGHEDVDFHQSSIYWSGELNLDVSLFRYARAIPKSSNHKRPKRILPYGTCRLSTGTGATEMQIKMSYWLDILRIK